MSSSQDQVPVLEVVFHSATDLPNPPFSVKEPKPYVMADIISPDTKPNWVKTITDKTGGKNPEWDFLIFFPLDQQKLEMARNYNLLGKIMHSGTALGDREIGHVKVRLPTLLDGTAAGENMSYPVVVSGGEERGRIFISHKLVPPPMGVEDPFLNTTSVVPDYHNQILELIFHSAIGLAHPLFNHKGSPYVKAAIVGLDTKTDWVKTVIDEKGGENPAWDYLIRLPLDQEMVRMARNFNLICKIVHFGKLGDRKIGQVKVRLQTLFAGTATGEHISYPVVSGGVEKGKIVISHRLVAGTDVSAPPPPPVVVVEDGVVPNAIEGLKLAASVTTIASAVYDAVGALS